MITDLYSKAQESPKLLLKRVGSFTITNLVGKNAVRSDLPDHFMIHQVVHVIRTTLYVEQPDDVSQPFISRPEPIPLIHGEEHVAQKIFAHRKRGRVFQFVTLMKDDLDHDATWELKGDFVDSDGTVTGNWHEDIVHDNSLFENYRSTKFKLR